MGLDYALVYIRIKYYDIRIWHFAELITHQDDEYVWAGVEDPRVVITTSHSPSSRLKQFVKVSVTHLCVCPITDS